MNLPPPGIDHYGLTNGPVSGLNERLDTLTKGGLLRNRLPRFYDRLDERDQQEIDLIEAQLNIVELPN